MKAMFLCVLALITPISAQTPIQLSSENERVAPSTLHGTVGDFVFVKASGDPKYTIRWQIIDSGLKMLDPAKLADKTEACFVASLPGQYRFICWYAETRDAPMMGVITIDTTPTPPTPTPPTPTPPTPTPPTPTPPTPPTPIPGQGFRVLILYETSQVTTYPRSQQLILELPGTLRQYLNAKCVVVNKLPEWRIYDKDVNISKESKVWQDAVARPRQGTLPWIIISDGTTGFEGPLPATLDETMALLRRYGGQ